MNSKLISIHYYNFTNNIVSKLVDRYRITYLREPDVNGIRYYLYIKASDKTLHSNIYISTMVLNKKKFINVEAFYPKLEKEEDSKFLSAALFYTIIADAQNRLGANAIILSCKEETYTNFYSKLKPLEFKDTGIKDEKKDHIFIIGNTNSLRVDLPKIEDEERF